VGVAHSDNVNSKGKTKLPFFIKTSLDLLLADQSGRIVPGLFSHEKLSVIVLISPGSRVTDEAAPWLVEAERRRGAEPFGYREKD
jgi:hypothetical protein